jgi:hypothetical protein
MTCFSKREYYREVSRLGFVLYNKQKEMKRAGERVLLVRTISRFLSNHEYLSSDEIADTVLLHSSYYIHPETPVRSKDRTPTQERAWDCFCFDVYDAVAELIEEAKRP